MKTTLAFFLALIIISSCNHNQPLPMDNSGSVATVINSDTAISEEAISDTIFSTPQAKIIPPSLPELTPIVAHFHHYQYVEGICDHGYNTTGKLPDLPYKNHTELNFKCDTLTKNEYNQDSYQRFRVHYFQYADSIQGGMARDSLLACFPTGCYDLLAQINKNGEEHNGIKCPTSLFIMNKTSIMMVYHETGNEKNWHKISNFIVKEYAEDDAEIITQNVFDDWGWQWHTLERYFQVFLP